MVRQIEAVPSPFPGVTVRLLQGELKRGTPQTLFVEVVGVNKIPLHRHETDAKMFVSRGRAKLNAPGTDYDGLEVQAGDSIFFPALGEHGFCDCSEDFAFFSFSRGIGDVNRDNWDMQVVSEA